MSDHSILSDITSDENSLSIKTVKETEELTDINKHLGSSSENFIINEKNVDIDVEPEKTESCEESDNETETSNKENEWEDILGSGSLMKLTLFKGKSNTRPQRSQNCKIKYVCTLDDGTVVEKHDVFELQLGDCEVVQGLDLALGLMNVGEICKLKLESRLAYGTKGLEPLVPPEATIHLEVELLSVELEDELETLTIHERRLKGNKKRERGNWWYSRGENQIAIQCYRRALDYLDEVEGGIKTPLLDGESEVTDAALQQLLEDRINVSNNMAAAQLKLELYDAALQSLQTVLRCQPQNVKALFRKAKVHRAKNDVQAALSCLKKAEQINPNNSDILKEIATLQKLKDKQKKSEKELARRMFNGLQNNPQSDKKDSNSKVRMWVTIGASLAVGLIGLAAYRFKFV